MLSSVYLHWTTKIVLSALAKWFKKDLNLPLNKAKLSIFIEDETSVKNGLVK